MSISNSLNNSIDSKSSLQNQNQNQNEIETIIKPSTIEGIDYQDPHSCLHNNKIINTLRSQQSLNTEEVKYLPYMLLEMQEALTKSNNNIINMKSTIDKLLTANKESNSKLLLTTKKYKRLKEKYYEMKYKSIDLITRQRNIEKMVLEGDDLNERIKTENRSLTKKLSLQKDENDELRKELLEIEEMKKGVLSFKVETERLAMENSYLKEHLKEKELKNLEYSKVYDCLNKKYLSIVDEKDGLNLRIKSIYDEMKEKEKRNLYYMQDSQRKDRRIDELAKENISLASFINRLSNENRHFRIELNLVKKLVLSLVENILPFHDGSDNVCKVLEEISEDIGYKEINIEGYILQNGNNFMISKRKDEDIYMNNTNNSNNDNIDHKDNKENKDYISAIEYIDILKHISNISVKFSNDMKQIKAENDKLTKRLKEEVELKNLIQEKYLSIRGNLRIMVRIRPTLHSESSIRSLVVKDNNVIATADSKKEYCFDKVYNHNVNTNEMFKDVNPLINSILKGKNSCLISYGATGTGKTYTIQGNKESKGLVYLIANDLFNRLEQMYSNSEVQSIESVKQWSLSMSMIEIYNESIYNLISDKETSTALNIYENSEGCLIIPELNTVEINSITECEKLIKIVNKLRQTSNNSFNERSSRSHCVITFYLKIFINGNPTKSKFNIIDLAGSERLSRCNYIIDDVQKKEVSYIHTSLNALSNVLYALASSQNHIPYRDSKLTHFLKESICEGYNLLLLLHLSPTYDELLESISTLEFGIRLGRLSKFRIGLID